MSMTGKNGPTGPMMTSGEAAKRLGITPRHFARLRVKLGGVDGAVLVEGAWAFPKESIEKLADRDVDLEAEEPETIEEGAAALTRAVVKAHNDVMTIAIDLLKLSLAEGKSKDERLAASQNAHLENMKLLREFMVGSGELEVERMKAEADQTVRLERTKVAASGMKLFAPIAKAGIARVLNMPALAKNAEAETMLALFERLSDEKRAKLLSIMTEKQREAFERLVVHAGALQSNIREDLKVLKLEMLDHPEQMQQAQEFLDQKEIQSMLSLFEHVDEEEEKKDAEKKSA